MTNLRGTNVASAILPFTDLDTYASHYAKYGKGGWRSVESYTDLDAISNDRLEKGMAVYVTNESTFYILTDLDLSADPVVKTWTQFESGGQIIQVERLPEASEGNVGKIYQYIGPDEPSESSYRLNYFSGQFQIAEPLDKETFENTIINEYGPEFLSEDLNISFTYNSDLLSWILVINNEQVGDVTTSGLANYGILFVSGQENIQNGDNIFVKYEAEFIPHQVNGYFYQCVLIDNESEMTSEVISGDFEVETNVDTYVDYVTEVLHEELEDKQYTFEYTSNGWEFDGDVYELENYGIIPTYTPTIIHVPASLEVIEESYISDPATVTCNISTFVTNAGQYLDINHSANISLIYDSDENSWMFSTSEESGESGGSGEFLYLTTAELDAIGINIDYNGGNASDGDYIGLRYTAEHDEIIPGEPTLGDTFGITFIAGSISYEWLEKEVQNISGKIDKFVILPEITDVNDGLIVQYVGETNQQYTQGYFYKAHFDDENPENSEWIEINCSAGQIVQVAEFPEITSENNNSIVQYVGESTQDYTQGYFYQAHYNSEQPEASDWEQINVQEEGTVDYNDLLNQPAIDGVTLTSETTKADLGLNTVYKYRGQVETVADLENIEDPALGDVYDVIENEHNYAWNGLTWDDLGGRSQIIQVETFPEATPENLGQIVEYIGETESGEASAEAININFTDPVEVSIDLETFMHAIVGVAGEQALTEDWILDFEYVAEDNWILSIEGHGVGSGTTEEFTSFFGVTFTFEQGSELHVNDSFSISYIGIHEPYIINGLFYQASAITHRDSFGARTNNDERFYITDAYKEGYVNYVVNTLHEELVDKDYTFEYSEIEEGWTLDGVVVNPNNYGIEFEYSYHEVEVPARLEFLSEQSYTQDPLSVTTNTTAFIEFCQHAGYPTDSDFDFGMKFIEGRGWDLNGNFLSDSDLEQAGIILDWGSGSVHDGDGIAFYFHAVSSESVLYEPEDGDEILANYRASYLTYGWLQKEVQGHKIDKFANLPEPTEANEGLIVQYVGETEEYESRVETSVNWYDGAEVFVEVNKTELEAALEHVEVENPLQQDWHMELSWNANDGKWDTIVFLNGEEVNQNSYSTDSLQEYGVYITINPDERDLQGCGIGLDYLPAHEGSWHNGYFYQSQKITEEELFEVSIADNLRSVLDEENPYTLDAETLVESQHLREGEGYDGQFCYGPTVTQNNSEPEDGWYDEWRGEHDPQTGYPYRVDLENDFGVTLNYREHDIQANRNAVALSALSSYVPQVYIDKIDIDTFERALLDYRIVNELPTEPTVFYFQCYGGDSEYWRVNGQDISNNYNNRIYLDNFGIYYGHLRAPAFINGDSITVYYTPDVQPENRKDLYCMVEGRFGNYAPDANGGYIVSLDTSVLEAELGTLPTTITYYTWKCTDGDTNAWTLDDVSADPADYGITLSSPSRAPTTPFITGDTFTLMYKPADKDIFRVSKSAFEGSGNGGGLDHLDIDLFKAYGYKAFVDNGFIYEGDLVQLSFRNIVDGSYSEARWYCNITGGEHTSDELASIGIVLNNPRAPVPYTTSDYILIDYIPVPYSFNDEPERDYRFNLSYRPESIYYDWVQKDVQPGVTDYNDLDNKPSIDGVTLTSGMSASDLSGSFVDLTSNQKANGTKIINELFKESSSNLQAVASTTYPCSMNWDCSSFLSRDENSVFVFGTLPSDIIGHYWYNQEEKEYPAFGIIEKSSGKLVDHGLNGSDWLYPLNPDPNMLATYNWYYRYGESTSGILSGFASNVVEWIDTQNNNKRWFFAITSPCILAKIDPDYLTAYEYGQAVVASWQLYEFDYYRNYKITLNRLRVQGDYIYAFQELGNGTPGGVYPVKFDIRNGYAEMPMGYSNRFSAGGYEAAGLGRGWGRNPDKDSGFDYQVMSTGGTDIAYLYIRNGNEQFYDVYGNYIEYPHGTIYKFPLDSMNPACDNLAYLGYQFNNDGSGKCEIKNILKLDGRYLLIYAYEDASAFLYLNLFDTSVDRVVARIYTKCSDFSDDYSVYKESDHVYKVSGFLNRDAERLYQVTINTAAQSFQERDMEFDYNSAYNSIMGDIPERLESSHTIFMWDDVDLVQDQETGYYRFETPIAYTRRQIGSGEKNYPIWMGVNSSLDRYATEGFVNSVLDASGYITADYLFSNNFVTQYWLEGGNYSYNYLANKPQLNGIEMWGNHNSRYYRIIDDYGINITDTQMIMNDKAIRYDTPFQISTVIQGGGSNYIRYDICYVIPSKTENNVYYQVVNYRRVNDSYDYFGIFRINTLLNESEEIISSQYDRQVLGGTYDHDRDTLVLITGQEYNTTLRYLVVENISSADVRNLKENPLVERSNPYVVSRDINYGTFEYLSGLFVDDCKAGTPYSGTVAGYTIFLHNSNEERTYKGILFLEDGQYYYSYCSKGSFKQSSTDFETMKGNIVRDINHYGVVGLNIVEKGFEVNEITQTGMNDNSTHLITKDRINGGLIAVSQQANWLGHGTYPNLEGNYVTLTEISGSGNTEYSIGYYQGALTAKVRVDGVQVYNFTIERDNNNNFCKVVFDSPVDPTAVVEAWSNGRAGGAVSFFDGTDWSDTLSDIVMPITYDTGSEVVDVRYDFLVSTEDTTYSYIAATTIDQNIYVTYSSDGVTWSNLSSVSYNTDATLIGFEYLNGNIYYILSNGRVLTAPESDIFSVSILTVSTDTDYLKATCCVDNKIYAVELYNYIENRYTARPAVFGFRFRVFDPANNTWETLSGPIDYLYAVSSTSDFYSSKFIFKHDGENFHLFKLSNHTIGNAVIWRTYYQLDQNSWYISKDLCNWQIAYEGSAWESFYSITVSDANQNRAHGQMADACSDGQGGLYFSISDGNKFYGAGKGLWTAPSSNKILVSNTASCDVDVGSSFYPSSNYTSSVIKFDTNSISALDSDYECYGAITPGYLYKDLSGSNMPTYEHFSYEYIMKGSNDDAYLTTTYNTMGSLDSSWNRYNAPRAEYVNQGGQVLVQTSYTAFIYMIDDDNAWICPGQYSTASAASYINGFGVIGADENISVDPITGYSRFKTAVFRVMPTFTIGSVRIQNNGGGQGYQVGERFTLLGMLTDGANPATIEITQVDANGAVEDIALINGGRYMQDPMAYSSNSIVFNGATGGSGLKIYANQSSIIEGNNSGVWTFGNLSVQNGDIITPDLSQNTTYGWMKNNPAIKDADLIKLRGSFENEGGIESIEAIDCRNIGTEEDYTKHYFYCLIRTVNGTAKAYRSEVISAFRTYPNGIRLEECSADLAEATAGTNYNISYIAQHAFVYSPDNFYITSPAFVNFKGKITDLYDTNFMELYTSHPTTGFVVPALSNKKFRHTFTKNSDFKSCYYNFKDIVQLGENWEAGIHQITTVFDTTDGDLEATVLFETDSLGHLKQVFSITPELGNYALNTNTVTIENPDTHSLADAIILEFECIDLNNTSFIPSIEKYGVVKRGYQVKNDMDDIDGYSDSNSVPTIYAVKQYVQEASSNVHSAVLTLGASDWDSNTNELTITGISDLTVSSIVLPVPHPNSMTDYMAANIVCTGQNNGELTFTCTNLPSNDITVNVIIM